MVDFDNPDRSAIDARDQWVALRGVCSRVATTTSSTWSKAIDGGRPGRCSSSRPSSRWPRNRERHLPTVVRSTPSCLATSTLDKPSAQAKTIRHRNANACDDFARCAQRCSVARSSPSSTSSTLGRPRPAIAPAYILRTNFRRRTLAARAQRNSHLL
jgi:hypothetical protein